MSTDPVEDLFAIFRGGNRWLAAQQLRQQCASEGHRYQIHGRTNPSRITCKRCRVSWAVGARTEPKD